MAVMRLAMLLAVTTLLHAVGMVRCASIGQHACQHAVRVSCGQVVFLLSEC